MVLYPSHVECSRSIVTFGTRSVSILEHAGKPTKN